MRRDQLRCRSTGTPGRFSGSRSPARSSSPSATSREGVRATKRCAARVSDSASAGDSTPSSSPSARSRRSSAARSSARARARVEQARERAGLADVGAQLEVAPLEPARERRQVVGHGERERARQVRAARPELDAVALEAEHAGREHAPGLELRRELARHRAEILADHERPRAPALEREHAEQLVGGLRDVGALAARPPGGNPELPLQAHHVVDAQRARGAEGGAQQAAQEAVAVGAQPLRDQRRQAPVLARGGVGVGRRAERRARRRTAPRHIQVSAESGALPIARSLHRPIRMPAPRARLARRARAGASSSNCSQQRKSISSACAAANSRTAARARVAQLGRPAPPVGLAQLGLQHLEGREVDELGPPSRAPRA